ncbi:hypothetical protein EYF80_038840 [Liparis tanakae]|uniref:Uncharacterized protein n=1 Tax=Liparis tanakae TaxID=230148 RepID=A0A4Z2GBH3_9TELE|nr:hypothetical protein EYF80_038840 [Liparis tanakae]
MKRVHLSSSPPPHPSGPDLSWISFLQLRAGATSFCWNENNEALKEEHIPSSVSKCSCTITLRGEVPAGELQKHYISHNATFR